MLLHVRVMAVARLAAVLVAATLTGAPRVLALHAPEEGHRCSCRAQRGEHRACECAACRRAVLAARASDEGAPPCHRAAAREALSKDEPAGSRDAPCLEGTCGGSGAPTAAPAGVEPFCVPSSKAVARPHRTEGRTRAAGTVADRTLEPETPPPRAA